MELRQDSCTRDYHVYNEVWTPVLGQVLLSESNLTLQDSLHIGAYRLEIISSN